MLATPLLSLLSQSGPNSRHACKGAWMVSTAPYGTWTSPLTASDVARAEVSLAQPWLDGGEVYWLERPPAEAGRSGLVRARADGCIEEFTPARFNVRTLVHEYGGGGYAAPGGGGGPGNDHRQRLYLLQAG